MNDTLQTGKTRWTHYHHGLAGLR